MLKPLIPQKAIYIHTCHDFYPSHDNFSWVKPIPSIQKKIDEVAERFMDNTVGVHIRRTDHIHSIRESPLDGFILEMEECLKQDPSTRFFLATDDEDTELVLKARFKERIIIQQKRFGRDSVAAIQDAVVDLFALSKTNLILASYSSLFSETAAILGTVKMKVVRRMQ